MIKFCANCGHENKYELVAPRECWKCKKSFSVSFIQSQKYEIPKRPQQEEEREYIENEDYTSPIKLEVEIDAYRGTTAKLGDIAQSQKTGVGRRDRPKQKRVSDKEYWENIRQESSRSEINFD